MTYNKWVVGENEDMGEDGSFRHHGLFQRGAALHEEQQRQIISYVNSHGKRAWTLPITSAPKIVNAGLRMFEKARERLANALRQNGRWKAGSIPPQPVLTLIEPYMTKKGDVQHGGHGKR